MFMLSKGLKARHINIVNSIMKDKTYAEVARDVFLSEKGVRHNINVMCKKLGTKKVSKISLILILLPYMIENEPENKKVDISLRLPMGSIA